MSVEFDQYLRMQMVGLFLSPVFYGMSIALASGSIRALFRQRMHYVDRPDLSTSSTGYGIANTLGRTRLTLLFYVVFIVGCASGALGQDVIWMKECEQQRLWFASWNTTHSGLPDDGPDSAQDLEKELLGHVRIGAPALVLAVWASSVFMVWRSVVYGMRIKSPLVREGLNIVMYILIATLVAAGILHFFSGSHIGMVPDEALLVLVTPPITAALALILILHCALLPSRKHSLYYRSAGLMGAAQYATKLTVESGALIVTVSTIYALLFFYDGSQDNIDLANGAKYYTHGLISHMAHGDRNQEPIKTFPDPITLDPKTPRSHRGHDVSVGARAAYWTVHTRSDELATTPLNYGESK